MKKLLSVVLSAALSLGLATVSFAATYKTISVSSSDYTLNTSLSSSLNAEGGFFPGETYYLDQVLVPQIDTTKSAVTLNSSNYSITANWTKGGAMVSGISIDNTNGAIKLKTNDNYTLTTAKDLVGTITLTAKKDDAANDGVLKSDKVVLSFAQTVTNDTEDITPFDSWDEAEDSPKDDLKEHTIYTSDGAGKFIFASDTSLIQLRASLKDDQTIAVDMDEDSDYEVIDYLDDKSIDYDDLYFYNINGKFSFSSGKAEAVVQSNFYNKPYIYTWSGGKLVTAKGTWDSGEGTYTVPVTGPTTFVLSETALIAEKENSSEASDSSSVEEDDEVGNSGTASNPDTGANDFVGLAVALAIVSVAGIAVAKKK